MNIKTDFFEDLLAEGCIPGRGAALEGIPVEAE